MPTPRLPFNPLELDPDAFDQEIRSQGPRMRHYKALPCPLGLVDRYDARAVHADHDDCQNGFIYRIAGEVTCMFTGNNADKTIRSQGELDSSVSYVTFPRFYDKSCCDSSEIYVGVYDKLEYLEDVPHVEEKQLMQYDPKGIDRLQYPVLKVLYVEDSSGKKYTDQDFQIVNGNIKWGSNCPGINPETNRGNVYAISYLYKPYWIIRSLTIDIRLSRQIASDGTRYLAKMPISVIAQREFQFMNQRNNGIDNSSRQQRSPVNDPGEE